MESILVKNLKKILINREEVEFKLKIKIFEKGNLVSVKGKKEDEYIALKVLEAIDFGFEIDEAFKLVEPDFVFEKLSIKDITKRKNLVQIRARIIGTRGKTIRTLCELTGCNILLSGNYVGVIAHAEQLKNVTIALESLIRGAKHSNVYSWLEKHQPEEIWDYGIKKKEE